MTEYKVRAIETIIKNYYVEADNEDDARKLAEEVYSFHEDENERYGIEFEIDEV